jgi:ABC-type Fe3+-hydroxamate transport system substrate-binding protein
MKKKQMYAIAAVVIIAVAAIGIYFAIPKNSDDGPTSMVDAAGNEIVIPSTVVSITAASPSIADIVCYMGYGSKIVCVSNYCSNSEIPSTVTTCGSYSNPDGDAISTADATITLIDGSNAKAVTVYETLKASGMNVVLMYGATSTISGTYSNVEIIGFLMKDYNSAEDLVDDMKGDVSSLADSTDGSSQTTVLISTGLGSLAIDSEGNFTNLSSFDGSKIYIAGSTSAICSMANAVSNMITPMSGSGWVAADTDWISTSTSDVDVLIVLWTNKASMPNEAAIEALIAQMKNTAWANCGAVQSGNIVFIGGDAGSDLSRVTPYTIERGLPMLSLYINPECYSATSGGSALSFNDLPKTVDNTNFSALLKYTENTPA